MFRKDIVPSTGRGRFDCLYFPVAGMMTITVNVYPVFEVDEREKLRWSSQDKALFKETARIAVRRVWNGRHRLVGTGENFGTTVVPHFQVAFVDTLEEASVRLKVPKFRSAYGPGGLPYCNSYVGLAQLNTGDPMAMSDGMVHSFAGHVIDIATIQGTSIVSDERRRLQDIVVALGLEAMAFGADSADLTAEHKVALANFASRAKAGTPSRPMVPILIQARAGTGEAGPVALATQRAEAVRRQLALFNLPNPVVALPMDPLGGAGVVSLVPDASFDDGFDGSVWYHIFAHEFGHMIGLPDEYDNTPPPDSSVKKDIAINRYIAMTQALGCGCPKFGAKTTSVMCYGEDVMRYHMATALEALMRMSGSDEWRIA